MFLVGESERKEWELIYQIICIFYLNWKNSVEFPVQVGRLSLPVSFILLLLFLERIENILSDNIEGEKEEIITELLKVIIAKSEAVRNP